MKAALRYALAIAAIAVVLGLKLALVPWVEHDTPFLLFFAAVLVASWFGGLGPGVLATFLAAVASAFFFMKPYWDIRVEEPTVRFRLAVFVGEGLFICLLVAIVNKARRRADAAVAQSRELEREILEASEQARRQIGHDLHDGLGQHLAGAAFRASALSRRLGDRSDPQDVQEVREIEQLLNRAVAWTRELADGMSPVRLRPDELPAALHELAGQTRDRAGIDCDFEHADSQEKATETVSKSLSAAAAVHLLHVARDAVQHAVREPHVTRVTIGLAPSDKRDAIVLTVRSNGKQNRSGSLAGDDIAWNAIACRARMIHAQLDVRRTGERGTELTCTCPLDTDRATRKRDDL